MKNPGSQKYVALTLLLLASLTASLVFAQSGRNTPSSDDNKKRPPARVKPVPPPPLQGGTPDSPQKTNQKDEDTVRVNSDLVTLIATVATPTGAPAVPLTRDDFEIYEDGVKQEVSDFARNADVALRMAVLFDSSSSVRPRIGFERKAAARFFKRVMRPQDQASLFAFSTDVTIIQDFTDKVPQLTKATNLLEAKGATRLYDAIYLAAEQLAPTKGRHVIVIVSDGGDTISVKTLKDALAAAHEADAVVYAVFTGTLSPSLNVHDLAAERALAALTDETGGEVYRPRINPEASDEQIDEQSIRELDGVFERLAEQLRTQYLLGFYPMNETRDGKFRKLEVKVKKPGYVVRARSGYYAPKE